MTAQEQEMLQGLIDRVSKTQLPEKDSDAENMLQNTLGKNPDGLYILAQTVLVQQYALEQAQRQLAQTQAQMNDLRAQNQQLQQQPAKHTSFLGSLLGRADDPPRQAAAPPPPPQVSQGQYAPVPPYPQQGYPQQGGFGQPAGYGGGFGAPQGGGFLRSALQTATGVAAGALAFQGIESLMHGFGHAAGYGSEFGPALGGGFGQSGPREEVINNYYGDAKPDGGTGDHSGSFLPDFNDKSTDPGKADVGRDFGDTSGRDYVDTTNATSNDMLSGSGDNGSGFAFADNDTDGSGAGLDDSASGDDPGSGFDDSSSDFDSGGDSGGGFDDSSSGGDGF